MPHLQVVVDEQREVLSWGVPTLGDGPFQRSVVRGVHEDHVQVTPREPSVGEPSQPLPVADQLVLDLTTMLLDQIEEPEDSPTVAPWLNTI